MFDFLDERIMRGFVTYRSLKAQKGFECHIPYGELLLTQEWRDRRENIINRDQGACRSCKRKATELISGKPARYLTESELNEYRVEAALAEKKSQAEWESSELRKKLELLLGKDFTSIRRKTEIPFAGLEENPVFLHVHHKYYVKASLPWEYPDDALITLCMDCHTAFHKENVVPVYEDKMRSVRLSVEFCQKCEGSGYIGEYWYYKEGVCFSCKGEQFRVL